MIILKTKRLLLRKFESTDLDGLAEIFADPEMMKYYSSTKNREESERWINWNQENYRAYGFGLWAVIYKQENLFIGDCGITMQNIDGEQKPEIGYHIHKSYWQQGFATEAASACRDFGFSRQNFSEIYVKTNSKNIPSKTVANKIGMNFRKEYESKSRPGELTCVYSITKQEWLKINDQENIELE